MRRSGAIDDSKSYWWLILLFVVLGMGLRFYQLLIPGHLFGLTEYDDGVYFGAALRLAQGYLPYKSFVMVQPPGIVVLLFPIAMFSHVIGTSGGLAVARCLTIFVDGVNIALVGRLARPKGKLALVIACSVMALYPAAIASSQTVLLEPYLNLFCLIGFSLLFMRGDLNRATSALIWGGIFIGIAGSVKTWAVLPALIALVAIVWATKSICRAGLFFAGTLIGFAAVSLPFIVASPASFLNEVIMVQLGRSARQRVGLAHRLIAMSGVDSFASVTGHALSISILVVAAFAVITFAALISYNSGAVALDYFAAGSLILVFIALLWPSDFYYHYPDFLTPFIALVLAFVGHRLLLREGRRKKALVRERWLTGICGATVVAFSLVQFLSEANIATAPLPAAFASSVIPPGACIVSDEIALIIESNRFLGVNARCPIAVDPYGTALAMSKGLTIGGGASRVAKVQSFWMAEMRAAQFLWLSPQDRRRLPWDSTSSAYLQSHFRLVAVSKTGLGRIYKSRSQPISVD